jgi:hypothetical protein
MTEYHKAPELTAEQWTLVRQCVREFVLISTFVDREPFNEFTYGDLHFNTPEEYETFRNDVLEIEKEFLKQEGEEWS